MPEREQKDPITRAKMPYTLAVGISLIILGVLFSNIPAMIASQNWPSTEGQIVSRTLLGQKFEEYDGDYYTSIEGYITYEYSVDGISYSSSAVNSTGESYFPYQTALKYPEGEAVLVYYNPRDPAKAVLEPGWVLSGESIGFFPALLLVAGIYLMARRARYSIQRYQKYNKLHRTIKTASDSKSQHTTKE